MLQIRCPYCGTRDHAEFVYGGDATKRRPPDDGASPLAEWIDYVYARENPRGPHAEIWQHALGCRAWVVVRRDTLTHDILETRPCGADGA